MKRKIVKMMDELYISNRDEIKTVGEWIKWATLKNAVIDSSPEKREVKIFIGTENQKVILRELQKYTIDRIN